MAEQNDNDKKNANPSKSIRGSNRPPTGRHSSRGSGNVDTQSADKESRRESSVYQFLELIPQILQLLPKVFRNPRLRFVAFLILISAILSGIFFSAVLVSELPSGGKLALAGAILIFIFGILWKGFAWALLASGDTHAALANAEGEPPVKIAKRRRTPQWFAVIFTFLASALVVGVGGWLQPHLLPIREPFDVGAMYYASGKIGDTGDVDLAGSVFVYRLEGIGPHQWDYSFDANGVVNQDPARFAGVIWLHPPNSFGQHPESGHDLRKYRKMIRWQARSLGGPVSIEFFIGGVTWNWNIVNGISKKLDAPFQDSMPRITLTNAVLTADWQTYEVSLSHIPKNSFSRVVGAFGWVADWGSNGVELDESRRKPKQTKELRFEIKNIQYVP